MNFLSSCLAAATVLFAGAVGAQVAPAPVPSAQPAAPTPVVPPAPAAPVARPLPASRWTPVQIQQSFEFADSDSDGELTRAEAQQLTVMPLKFEDMDANKDGIVTRSEYESQFAR